jgi:hypothetical protein
MKKVKGEPGDFKSYDEVVKLLTAPAYGAGDLVELGLFHTEHFVRDAIACGKIKFQKVNKRAVILCRDDILEYWHKYRNEPYEAANNTLPVKLTMSEVKYLGSLVGQGQNRIDREFSFSDLFRNIIKHMKKNNTSVDTQPQLFVKNY